jgi:D-alanyl-D-alanine carboxypeptidase (penicillin-binding protein 5/6)
MIRFLAALALSVTGATSALAQGFETSAGAAWVYDQTTGTVLMEKNSHEPLPPASMSKLMTIYMAFEAVENGTLTLDTTLPVSEHAMSFGGSTMFLNTLDRPTVEELLLGVVVLSGNDASVVLAEALSPDGTEAGFAELMNERAQEIGLVDSHFVNSTGWPAEGHLMSMSDLGLLAERLIEDFPELYKMFAEEEFEYDGRAPANTQNRNPILGLVPGADGLKTGHTEEAGYGFVGSAVQDGRRVIFVVTGLGSMEARRTESERILNWAFRQFSLHEVAEAGTRLGEADVWMGAQSRVGLVAPQGLAVLVPATGEVDAEIAYQGPVAAPITAGQEIASLVLRREGMPEMRIPLAAEVDVPRGGLMPRVTTAVGVLMGMAGLRAEPGATDPAADGEAGDATPEGEETADAPAEPASTEEAPAETATADAPAEDAATEETTAESEGLQVGE